MPKIYDDDGNEVELDVNLNELPEVLEKSKTLEDQLKQAEGKLKALEEKNINFANLRSKTKAEQEEFKAKMNEKERMFFDKIESLETQIAERDKATIGKAKNERIKQLSGGDEDLQKKIEANLERLGINPLSVDQLNDQLEEAYALTQVQVQRTQNINPLNQYTPSSGGQNPWGSKKKNFADTDEGQSFAKSLGLNVAPKK